MSVADRLIDKAKDYEQRAAHFQERAEHTLKDGDAMTANAWVIVAIVLREVAQVVMEEHEEDLAA